MNKLFKNNVLLIIVFIAFGPSSNKAQVQSISIEEAFEIASKSYAGLKYDQLNVKQQRFLAGGGAMQLPTQIFISGEEFDFANNSGVHSININQNFLLPKVSRAHQRYYERGTELAEKKLALTEKELKRQVGQSYYQLLFAKQDQELVEEALQLYNSFLSLTTTQLEAGETGKMPQLAAKSRHGQALLEMEHAEEQHQIALTLFNNWLGADSTYVVSGDFPINIGLLTDSIKNNNPHLQINRARIDMAAAKVEMEKVKLAPQINSGFKLQTAGGSFPLFGYQLGLDVPLFNKSYKNRIQAAEIGIEIEEASLLKERQYLERNIDELTYRLEHQLHIVDYLENELSPIVNEQSTLNLKAYSEGEIGYLEYLDGLEQVLMVKRQYLMALYQLNAIKIELNYWAGE